MLELVNIQEPRAGGSRSPLRGGWRQDAWVRGLDLRQHLLKGLDLLAQLPPAADARAGRIGGGLRHDVERGGDLTGIDPALVGLSGCASGDVVHRGGLRWRGGNERAAALLCVDQLLLGEALVDRSDGVRVDAQGIGEVTQARKSLLGRKAAVADACAQSPRQLHADRYLGTPVDCDVQALDIGEIPQQDHVRSLAANESG